GCCFGLRSLPPAAFPCFWWPRDAPADDERHAGGQTGDLEFAAIHVVVERTAAQPCFFNVSKRQTFFDRAARRWEALSFRANFRAVHGIMRGGERADVMDVESLSALA